MPKPIVDNRYQLEIFQGPLLAPIHVVGVGGAYVAYAQDTEGSAVNAASPAVRDPYSLRWFDYDLSAGISLPNFLSTGNTNDFDNRGPSTTGNAPTINVNDFVDLNFGLTLQFGQLGFAVTGDLQQFTLAPRNVTGPTMQIGRWKALAAYGFFDGQLLIGGGARILTTQIFQSGGATLLTMAGAAPEVGALYMPTGVQWRFGAAGRAPVTGGTSGSDNLTNQNGVLKAGNFVLPSEVTLPWEVEVGAAYQLGPRPINPGWQDPHEQEKWIRQQIDEQRAERALLHQAELAIAPPEQRARRALEIAADEKVQRALEEKEFDDESRRLYLQRRARYENWPREKILLLASVLLSGASSQAVSLQGFLDQQVEAVGRKVTATPRIGIEGEPLRDLLTVRVGSYVEPSRYADGNPRQHFTFGGDVRLFPLDFWNLLPRAVWKIAFMVDLAPRYQNYGIGVGNWH
jgi:hypothetical protein